MNNVIRFSLYHELGHALIDAYHIPVLGQEEDAADALGAILSLNYLKRGYHVVLDTADFWRLLDTLPGRSDDRAFWNEHALDKQRYYHLLCYADGKYPADVKRKVKQYYGTELDEFLKDREAYCDMEYNDTYNSWMGILKPYLKAPSLRGEAIQ